MPNKNYEHLFFSFLDLIFTSVIICQKSWPKSSSLLWLEVKWIHSEPGINLLKRDTEAENDYYGKQAAPSRLGRTKPTNAIIPVATWDWLQKQLPSSDAKIQPWKEEVCIRCTSYQLLFCICIADSIIWILLRVKFSDSAFLAEVCRQLLFSVSFEHALLQGKACMNFVFPVFVT